MKRMLLFIFGMAMLLAPVPAHGQQWSGILTTSRATTWSGNGANITNRTTQCGATIAAYGSSGSPQSAATINSALSTCAGSGGYVQLGAGTFYLNTSIVTTASNVTLRGEGPNTTFIIFTALSSSCNGVGGTSLCVWNGDSAAFNYSSGNIANWTAGYSQGTTTLTLSTTSGPSVLQVGMNLILTQNDDTSDPGNIWVCQTSGTTGTCSQQGGGGVAKAGAAESQNVTVIGISGNQVTVSPAIAAPNWVGTKSPTAWWSSIQPVTGFGIENLSLDYSNLGEEENGIEFHNANNCWVLNVRSINNTASGGATHKHVNLYDSNHMTVQSSYFYGASPTSEGYGVDNGPGSANDLAENNIFQHMPTGMINETTCCDVFGYNYSVDNYYNNGAPNWQQQGEFHHGAGDYYILWEGNENVSGADFDDIHGTSFFLTHFRDYLAGHDPATEVATKNQATFAYFPFSNNRYDNVVGSVLGTQTYHTFYQNVPTSTTDCNGTSGNSALSVFVLGFGDQAGTGFSSACVGAGFTIYNDLNIPTNLMRWGNYAACTGDAACNAVRWQSSETASSAPVYPGLSSPTQTLPASFYHASQPSFWGSMPWPAVGPDVTGGNVSNVGGHVYLNPAANCYLNVMGGLTTGASGALTFNPGSCYNSTPPVPTSTINWSSVHQVIDGFGATEPISPNANLTTAQKNLFFGTGTGQLGLSLLRVPATVNGGTGPGNCSTISTSCAGSYVTDMQAIVAQGGRVYASPWSPPAAYKTNGQLSCSGGSGSGALVTGDYASYATWLTNFLLSLKTLESVNVYALSVQNEPNNCPSYDGALYSGANFDTFVKSNLGPTFASNSISTLIFLPETENYSGLSGYGSTCFTDSSCYNYTGGANWHDYDATANSSGTVNSTPNPWALGQKYWETEVACGNGYGPSGCESGTTFVTDMTTDGLMWAGLIDNRIAVQNANAYLYFALVGGGNTDNLGLISPASSTVPARAYVFGQYSKFIRPGYYRIDATHAPQSGVAVSAYQNTPGGNLVIVATNYNSSPVSQGFTMTNAPSFSSVTPYVTSQSLGIAQQSAVSVSGNSFTYSLPAQSVTTFVGTAAATSGFVQATGIKGHSIAFSSNVTAGHALYAFAFCGVSATCNIAVTSTNESWSTPITTALTTDGDTMGISCAIAATSGPDTVSATGNGVASDIAYLQIYEMAGATCSLDTTTSPSGGYVTTDSTQTTPISSGNITTSTANDFMFYYAGASGSPGAVTWTAAPGFLNLTCIDVAVGYNPSCVSTNDLQTAVQWKQFSPPGTTSSSITSSTGSSQEYGTIYVAFKPTATVAAPTIGILMIK